MLVVVLAIVIIVVGVFALLPGYLIVIARRKVTRMEPWDVPRLHQYSLSLQILCYGSFVYLALSQIAQSFNLVTSEPLGVPIPLALGLACIANIAMAARSGPLRDLLITNGLLIVVNVWLLLAVTSTW
ncbi:hypothetical protein Acid345_0170 [Candidatus Koribacter versatilis Ellin345]|uniref:Uncharacterized protein n=1 Tax=Koribacter versatilis (strain Ellin345) TaxID=204669 RepID=Q1IVC5_KORVE|nr:hypothetical protein [Candidatus Koribacter versatilis]ABF39175.1 hypothetical protein Acid345_0170 [Candidatus Koribacter versatilis Ellin345]